MDGYIKLGFLTGVTKFGKVSVFSDLNNLKDISMRRDYNDICGITDEELHQYFDKDLHLLAEAQNMDYDSVCLEMKKRYDGYHFNFNTPGIYNPFSLLNTFDSMAFGNYWFATGTPSYLVYLLKSIITGWKKFREWRLRQMCWTVSIRKVLIPFLLSIRADI